MAIQFERGNLFEMANPFERAIPFVEAKCVTAMAAFDVSETMANSECSAPEEDNSRAALEEEGQLSAHGHTHRGTLHTSEATAASVCKEMVPSHNAQALSLCSAFHRIASLPRDAARTLGGDPVACPLIDHPDGFDLRFPSDCCVP